MESKLEKNKELILFVILLIIFIVYNYSKRQQDNERNYDFEKYGMFTQGRVVEYSPKIIQRYAPTPPEIKFSYLVQGKYYLEKSESYVPNENGPQAGSFFMAVYLPKYPQISGLLLDYPIKSAGDYNKYIKEFKIHRPKFSKVANE